MNTMTVKQTLKCSIHSPEKWQEDYDGYDADNTNNLPNLAPARVYAVDDYPACPDNWEHGSGIAGSYFVGLAEDGALWLDFNECFDHTHDVAIVLSVQGINPITGQTMVGDNPLRMEQYHNNCPIHNTPFKQDCFCDDCGFSWPGQNYMATTGTPFGMFWLDGFRTPDGNVRQYVISAEKIRSVAAQVMEKRGEDSEDRVFAIGVAFYLSKDKKPDMPKFEKTEPKKTLGFIGTVQVQQTSPMFFSPLHTSQSWGKRKGGMGKKYGSSTGGSHGPSSSSKSSSSKSSSTASSSDKTRGGTLEASSLDNIAMNMVEPIRRSVEYAADIDLVTDNLDSCAIDSLNMDVVDSRYDRTVYQLSPNLTDEQKAQVAQAEADGTDVERYYTLNKDAAIGITTPDSAMDTVIETVTPVKRLEVGAGALVSQRIYDDPKNLKKYWEETPDGMIYINYCDEETLKKILDGGKKATKKDGFMDKIQVG